MTDIQNHSLKPMPVANYNSAIARAVEWLGDRYLLAKPINAAPRSRNTDGGAIIDLHSSLGTLPADEALEKMTVAP